MTEYEVCQQNTMACEQEIAKGIIGQKDVIRQVMLALLAGGNVLLEGMPGLGKTMLVRTISPMRIALIWSTRCWTLALPLISSVMLQPLSPGEIHSSTTSSLGMPPALPLSTP